MNDRPDIHTLTGAYAVDALPDDEREVFEQHLLVCAACAQEVVELQATASRLGELVAQPPPPALKERVLAEVDATRQLPPAPSDPRAARGASDGGRAAPPRWAVAALGAAAALLLVVVVGLAVTMSSMQDRLSDAEVTAGRLERILAAPDAMMVEEEGADGMAGKVIAAPSRGEAVFMATSMAPPPDAHTYQLWLIGEDGPQPAGMFEPEPDGTATYALSGELDGATVGVTVEPEGGSAQPTSDPSMMLELG